MKAVGKLGTYISRGVSNVSSPFHLFGGAVDIIVVEQPDGSFKTSPWYVQFGKFQGVLKAREKTLSINVNGVDATFYMYLNNNGEAYFLREVYEEGSTESNLSSLGHDTDGSINYISEKGRSVSDSDVTNRKMHKIFEFLVKSRSGKENGYRQSAHRMVRECSVDRAEMAARLLDVEWSTNLATTRSKKSDTSRVDDTLNRKDCHYDEDQCSSSSFRDNHLDPFTLEETYLELTQLVPDSSRPTNQADSKGTYQSDESENLNVGNAQEISDRDSSVSHSMALISNENGFPSGQEHRHTLAFLEGANESSAEQVHSYTCRETLGSLTEQSLDKSCREDSCNNIPFGCSACKKVSDNENDRFYEVALLGLGTGMGASVIPQVEQFLMEGLCLSERPKIEVVESIVAESTGNKLQIEGWSESSEIIADNTNVVEGSKIIRGNSKVTVPKQLEVSQTSSIPSDTGRAYNDVDDPEQTTLSSLSSNENEMTAPGANNFVSRSLYSDLIQSEDSKITEEIKRFLSEPSVELSLCGSLLSEGMGYDAASCAFDSKKLDMGELTSIGPDLVKDTRLIVRIGGLYFPWDAAVRIVSMVGYSDQILEPKGMIAIDQTEKDFEEDPDRYGSPKRSKWKSSPFSANKLDIMMDGTQSITMGAIDTTEGMLKETDVVYKIVSTKKVIKTKMPTSEELASLNLKKGKNTVTFTFSTPMLGEQKVEARIFLWNWNAQIVISDVDGTITKSDVLGQFMPLMGYDWSQTGVAPLFSAIKENGYQLLFLSARAISQAYYTRQFLINLKQDGVALPEGPVVISPDGLFPSLYREVIRRAPHEFKITCLQDIKALFPPDYNPFYAGFGNRITDEMSYLKVGIPKGKIFTINPKGQVAVHQRVDTKSYSCLHDIVHDMFPPPSLTSSTEQEDYNSWNFWRLPPSNIF